MPLLRDLSFYVEPGRTVAIVGATASGKSTLTNLMTRLVDPDAGAITVDGTDLRDLRPRRPGRGRSPRSRRPRSSSTTPSAATSPSAPTSPTRTCGRRCATRRPTASSPRSSTVSTPPLGERGTSLSGGQRQRISLARALVRRPRLLILDDATSAVDPEVEARILASLRDGASDTTLVVVAYRKATIALADEVVHLEDGRIADRGTHTELLAPQPRLRPPGQRLRAGRRRGGLMTAVSTERRAAGAGVDSGEDIGAMETIRRGVHFSPELREGIGVTLLLAVVASMGQVIVPIAVQQTLDHGLDGPAAPTCRSSCWLGVAARLAIVVTSVASYLMTSRLFTTSERGLATLRIKAFRHVHDLPLLTQNTERRGALVSRVTTDVDQVSQFLVFGGLIFVVSVGQMLVATVIMVIYSWQLALVVWLCLRAAVRLDPLLPAQALGRLQRRAPPGRRAALGDQRARRRRRGGPFVRRRGPHPARIDDAIDEFKDASTRAQRFTVVSFSLGGISAGLANAGVLVVGVLLGFTTRHDGRQGAGLRVPGDAVRRAGADGHPDPHRRPERHRLAGAG